MAYQKHGQQKNASYGMSTFQFWLDRMEQTINQCFKKQVPDAIRNMNVRQFHSVSFLDLLELRRKPEHVVNVDPRVREETQHLGDCCTVTFLEFGLSMEKDDFYDQDIAGELEYKYSVNEELFTWQMIFFVEGERHGFPLSTFGYCWASRDVKTREKIILERGIQEEKGRTEEKASKG